MSTQYLVLLIVAIGFRIVSIICVSRPKRQTTDMISTIFLMLYFICINEFILYWMSVIMFTVQIRYVVIIQPLPKLFHDMFIHEFHNKDAVSK